MLVVTKHFNQRSKSKYHNLLISFQILIFKCFFQYIEIVLSCSQLDIKLIVLANILWQLRVHYTILSHCV